MKSSSPDRSSKQSPRPLPKNDLALLASIDKYRVVTIRQLAVISGRSCQVVRRRLRSLESRGVIIKRPFGYGRGQGRPEEILVLSRSGEELLNEMDYKSRQPPLDLNHHPIGHDLLKNWFLLHWINQGRGKPVLSFEYLSAMGQAPVIRLLNNPDINGASAKGIPAILIPDSILAIKHKETGQALLFFLEVDMGSETMVSRRKNTNTIYHKILGYQHLFRKEQYKCFEKPFSSHFKGFRVLFLAESDTRVAALGRFIRTTPPSEFIWLTDQTRMFNHGLSANIWVRGGHYAEPRQSILGQNMAFESPLLPTIS